MHITDELRAELTPHLTTEDGWANNKKPPSALYALVAGLVKPGSIEASLVYTTTHDEQTRWAVWILTPAALGYVDVTFDGSYFAEHEENDRLGASSLNRKVAVAITEARIEAFAGVIKAEFIAGNNEDQLKISYVNADWVPTPHLKLTFADDGRGPLIIFGDDAKSEKGKEERDKFLHAVRDRLPF